MKRGHQQRDADQQVPAEPEAGQRGVLDVGQFVDEARRAVQRERRDDAARQRASQRLAEQDRRRPARHSRSPPTRAGRPSRSPARARARSRVSSAAARSIALSSAMRARARARGCGRRLQRGDRASVDAVHGAEPLPLDSGGIVAANRALAAVTALRVTVTRESTAAPSIVRHDMARDTRHHHGRHSADLRSARLQQGRPQGVRRPAFPALRGRSELGAAAARAKRSG